MRLPLLIASAFAVVGTASVLMSHAATPANSIEPETETIAGNAVVVADATASGGGFVRFGNNAQPDAYGHLTMWLKADAITGLASGAAVNTWTDSSTAGANAARNTTAPTYQTNVVNGKPVVRFNGTNSLISSAPTGGGEQTIIVVIRPTTVSGSGVIRGGTAGSLGARLSDGYLQLLAVNTANVGLSSVPINANQWIVATYTYSDSGNKATFRLNGGDSGVASNATQTLGPGTTYIGSRPEGDENFNGDLAEIATYDSVLSPQQLSSIETGLMSKYGIASTTVNVPAWPEGLTPTITLNEEFNPPWSNWPFSPDGKWRIAGGWVGTGGNWLDPANASVVASHNGQAGGYLNLISRANTYSGAEIQTQGNTGGPKYGYYETRMKVTPTPGVCDSFFWIGANYTGGEIDVEFLTDESWIGTPDKGIVHFSVHNAGNTLNAHRAYDLDFNPSLDFHRYGWLWTPDILAFTVDGAVVWVLPSSFDITTNIASSGYIMANTWTGQQGWGGGPPTSDATTVYDWMRYYADAPSIPPN